MARFPGKGPGCGCPDNHIQVIKAFNYSLELALVIPYREFDINGVAVVFLVLNFSFGKSGLWEEHQYTGRIPL